VPADHVNSISQVRGYLCIIPTGAEDQDTLADLDMIPRMKYGVRNLVVVHEGAIGAGEIDNMVLAILKAKFRVSARHFRVVQSELIASIATDGVHELG
jgi:hypothetical protein